MREQRGVSGQNSKLLSYAHIVTPRIPLSEKMGEFFAMLRQRIRLQTQNQPITTGIFVM